MLRLRRGLLRRPHPPLLDVQGLGPMGLGRDSYLRMGLGAEGGRASAGALPPLLRASLLLPLRMPTVYGSLAYHQHSPLPSHCPPNYSRCAHLAVISLSSPSLLRMPRQAAPNLHTNAYLLTPAHLPTHLPPRVSSSARCSSPSPS